MILYLDTSALIKKFVKEPGSETVMQLWKECEGIAISDVGFAEGMAAFQRKKREGKIAKKILRPLIQTFRTDWESFIRVGVTQDLNPIIEKLVTLHPLRGFDAIHLASAISLIPIFKGRLQFVCSDKGLLKAAKKEGLAICEV